MRLVLLPLNAIWRWESEEQLQRWVHGDFLQTAEDNFQKAKLAFTKKKMFSLLVQPVAILFFFFFFFKSIAASSFECFSHTVSGAGLACLCQEMRRLIGLSWKEPTEHCFTAFIYYFSFEFHLLTTKTQKRLSVQCAANAYSCSAWAGIALKCALSISWLSNTDQQLWWFHIMWKQQ